MSIVKGVFRVLVVVFVILVVAVIGVWVGLRQPNTGAIAMPVSSRSDPDALRRHVTALSTELAPRSFRNRENLLKIADYIKREFEAAGADVRCREYFAESGGSGETEQTNVVARFGGSSGPLVVVGAHYDTFGELPGADDNASGVAGLLELGRLLGAHEPQGPVELVAYSTEEPPFFGSEQMGSALHALDLAEGNTQVTAMICLEMIGYFVPRQPAEIPALKLVYPHHGFFAAVVGRWADRGLARVVKKCFRGASDLPVVSYSGPTSIGADLSDHRNYWQHGYPAVMITDTAFMRNPNYHTGGDTADTLDYVRMAQVVDGVFNSVLHLSDKK